MKSTLLANKLGISTSLVLVYLIHCFVVPFLLILGLDSLLHAPEQQWIEIVPILSLLAIGIFSFLKGYLRHCQYFVPILFLVGFLFLINAEVVARSLWLTVCLSVTGALMISYVHFQNLKLKKLHATAH